MVALESVSVKEPIPALVLSNAFRTAVVAALKTLAGEVAADGVTVNAIATRAGGDGSLPRALRYRGEKGKGGGEGADAAAGDAGGIRARWSRSSAAKERGT